MAVITVRVRLSLHLTSPGPRSRRYSEGCLRQRVRTYPRGMVGVSFKVLSGGICRNLKVQTATAWKLVESSICT